MYKRLKHLLTYKKCGVYSGKGKKMKKVLMIFLSILSGLFLLFGIMGIAVFISEKDIAALIFFTVWSLLGAFLFAFFLKRAKHNATKIEHCNKPKVQAPVSKAKNDYSEAKTSSHNNEIHRQIIDSVQHSEQKEKFNIDISKRKNNAPLAYQYNHQEILELNYDFAFTCAQNNMWELSANIEGDNVALYSNGKRIGVLGGKRVEMMKDWIKNNEPYTIILEGIDSENKKAIAYLAFYRDKRAKMSYREQTTVRLTNCKKEDQQMIISSLESGDELYLSEEYNDRTDSEYVAVEESCVEIGRLPKKACERYLDEGAAGCFFDYSDYDEEKDIYVPYVTIYW